MPKMEVGLSLESHPIFIFSLKKTIFHLNFSERFNIQKNLPTTSLPKVITEVLNRNKGIVQILHLVKIFIYALFVPLRFLRGQHLFDLAGGWHLFSMHVEYGLN